MVLLVCPTTRLQRLKKLRKASVKKACSLAEIRAANLQTNEKTTLDRVFLVKQFRPFAQTEVSLLYSQQHASNPYPKSDECNPHFPRYLPKINFNINYHLNVGLPSSPFPSGFPTKVLYAILIYPMPH
jgi:hypothetical protein